MVGALEDGMGIGLAHGKRNSWRSLLVEVTDERGIDRAYLREMDDRRTMDDELVDVVVLGSKAPD